MKEKTTLQSLYYNGSRMINETLISLDIPINKKPQRNSKKNFKQLIVLLLLFVVLGIGKSWGQTSIATSGSAVVSNFTGYTGTSTLPANWTTSGTGTNGNNFAGTNQSAGTAGGWYGNGNMSYLGSGTASNGNATWRLQNNTGSTITSFDISFVARLWRSQASSPVVSLTYGTNTTGTVPAAGALTSILTFSDATANITTGTTLSQTISSISIPSGDYIYIRFIHAGGGTSDNIGWDDVSITAYSAINFFWNGSTTTGTGTAIGGSGTWVAASNNWISPTNNASGTPTNWANSTSNTANFANGSGTVTMGTSITAANTIIGAAGYTFAPSTNISLTSPVTLISLLTVAPTTSTAFTLSGVLSGAGGITQNGAGTTIVSGNSTHTGITTVTSGTLQLGAGGSGANTPLGTTSAGTTVSSGGVLDLNGFTLVTAEALTLNGTGISSGGALINSSATAASYSGTVAMASNSSIGTTGNITLSGVVSGGSLLTKVGAGVLTLTADNTYSGGTTVSAGELRVNPSANESLAGTLNFNGGRLSTTAIATSRTLTFASIDLSANSDLVLGATPHTLTFTARGTFTFSTTLTITGWTGASYFTGTTTGTNGKVFIGNSASLTAGELSQIRFFNGTDYFPAIQLSTGEIVPTSQLFITTITNKTAGVGFDVIVTARDINGVTARNLTQATGITLTSATNTIGGTTTGIITAGTSSITISGVTLTAGINATITATRSSGDFPRTTTSNTFDVATPATPILSAGTLTGFGSSVCVGTTAGPNAFTLSGAALDGTDVSVSGNAVYTFATTAGGSYSNPLTLTAYNGTSPSSIFVQFTPTAAANYDGNITISGGGATSVTTAVTGSGINGTPAVTTVAASSITAISASSGGNTISTTCGTITAKGVVWALTANPTISSNLGITSDGTGTTAYTSSMGSLTANTLYHYRAYLTNSNGITTYGSNLTFTTLKAEPTNYPTAFACGTTTATTIPLTWTDASAGSIPDGYLIQWSNTSYASITAPSDGTPVTDLANATLGARNVAQGVGAYTIPTLTSNTTYFMRIWSYTNSGSNIDYKLVGDPQTSCATLIAPVVIYSNDMDPGATASPYTQAPDVFDTNLSTPTQWASSTGAFTNFGGATGQSLVIQPSNGVTSSMTLTFDVDSGYACDITSFNFWRQRSATGPTTINSISINGTTVATNITVPTTAGSIGNTTVSTPITGLTGTVTVVLNLSAPSSTGQNFRLDDFTLSGNVVSIGTITTGTITGSPFCAGSTGVSVPFTYTPSANFPNGACTFTAQLSDASGLFGTPVNLQSVTSDASGSQSISVTIPSGTATSAFYRIRVVSASPTVNGQPNTVDLDIRNSATTIAPTTIQNILTSVNGTTLTVTEGYAVSSRQWKYGTVPGGPYGTNLGTAATQVPNFALANTYYIVCESTYGAPCSNTVTSNEVQIVVTTPAPEINVVGNSVTIADNDLTPTTADHTDFSNVAWGASFTRTYTIQNTGTGTLTITLPIVIGGAQAGDYAVTTPPSATIAPGGSSNFIVTFTPSAIGTRAGSITINNDDSNEAIYNFNIQGTGTPSNLSTIEFNTSTTPQNIDYSLVANQVNDLVSTSLAVMEFRIRDGGPTNTDEDDLGTTLNAITLNITNWANLKRLALYNGTTEIAEAAVTGPTLTFSGLTGASVTAPDNQNRIITVRVSFQTTVTDNQQFSFSFGNANVTALSTNSQFTAFTTVTSETTADRNRIEVTADRLAFATQPTDGSVSVNLAPFTVRFRDVNNNLDFDTNRTVTLSTSGLNMSPVTPSVTITAPHTGIATFSAVSFTSGPQTNINLTATTTGLLTDNDDISNDFDILNFTYLAGDYRPNYAGSDFSFNGGWDSFNGTTWTLGVTAPENLPAGTSNKPGRIIIDKASITGGGSTNETYNDIIIINGGELTFVDDDPTPTLEIVFASKTIEVQAGGTLRIQGDIDMPTSTTANLIVRNGGSLYLNQASIDYDHTMWEGRELFEGGSSVIINDWRFTGTGQGALINGASTPTIATNANGYIFGNLIVDVTSLKFINTWTLVGGSLGIVNLCENNLDINNESTNSIYGATNRTGTNGFVVNGNLTIFDGPFSFGFNFDNNPFNHQFIINGNFECASDDVLKVNHVNGTLTNNLAGSVTFKGDVIVASTVTSFLNEGGTGAGNTRMSVNFEGGTLADPNILDVAPIAVAVPMTIGNGSTATFVKLRTQDLVTNSVTSYTAPFTVTTNALLDFGYNTLGTTALNIRKTTTSPAGTNTFVSNTASTLVITSPDGIQQASGTTGNVQYTTGNKTFNQLATFWYKGVANQVTGDALTTAPNGKVLIVELNALATTLTLTNGTAITNATSVDPLGGKLEIRQGTLVSSAIAPITSDGRLIMTGGAYRIAELTTCPQLTGAYTLTGGTVNLDGAGNQVLRGARDYVNLTFSTSGTKTLSTALPVSSLNDLVTIQDAAILDVANNNFDGVSALNMTGTSRFRMSYLGITLPELTGTYTLNGGTVELYGTGAGQTHSLRGTVTYNNVELNSTAATVGAGLANVVAGASFGLRGAMVVNSPTCFQLASGFTITDAGTSSFALAAGATIKYGGTIDASGATGNIQTDNRTFPTTASYGFVGSTAQTTGTGLPSSMVNLYMDKDASTNFVTLTNPTTVTGALTFYKGKLDIVANNLTVDSSGNITGASASDYLVTSSTGTLIRNISGSGTFTYPIGSATAYNPSSFVWAASPGITSYALRYVATTATTGSGLPAAAGCVSAGTLVNNGHWIGTSVGTATNSPTITFTRNGHTNAGANLNLHAILRRNDSSSAWGVAGTWSDPGATAISPVTAQISLTQTALATVNNFSGEFVIATGTNATSTAAVLSAAAPTICTGTSPSLSVAISGSGSLYDIVYSDGTSNFTVNNYASGTPFAASATSINKTYSIVSVTIGGSCAGSGNSGTPTVNIGGTSTYSGTTWSSTPTATSTAIITSNYSQSANITACSLTVNNNAIVTIPSTFKVTLTGALTVANGSSFTLQNDSNLVQNEGITNPNTGSIIVNRNSSSLYLLDYTLWSSPVENQNLSAFSPRTLANRFYVYDTPTNQYAPIASSNNFTVAKGYLIRVPKDYSSTTPAIYNGVFTGKPNSGTITFPMSISGTLPIGTGFNAVGNPYPSQINVHNFIDANISNITGVLYFWRKKNDQTQPSYSTLTKLGYVANSAPGGGTANTFNYFNTSNNAANTWVINVGQGFFVKATNAANLVFTNAMRRGVNNSNQFFRTSNKSNGDVSLYKLNLTSNNGFFSQMLVGYSPDYTLGVDPGIDGLNINNQEYICSSIDGVAYAIQGRPEFTPLDVVPLQYKIEIGNEYTITIEQFDGLFADQDVFIKDKLTNVIHNLKTGPYTFGSEPGTFTNRFEVVYENPLSTSDPKFNQNSVVVYKQNQDVVVNTGTVQMSNVKIYDIRGRLLASKSNINASQVKLYAGTTQQVLIVKITSDTNTVVTKKVIN